MQPALLVPAQARHGQQQLVEHVAGGAVARELQVARARARWQVDVARGFEELVKIQSDEFKKLTDNVGEFFGGKKKK